MRAQRVLLRSEHAVGGGWRRAACQQLVGAAAAPRRPAHMPLSSGPKPGGQVTIAAAVTGGICPGTQKG